MRRFITMTLSGNQHMMDVGCNIIFVAGLVFLYKFFEGLLSFLIKFINLYILAPRLDRDIVSTFGKWALVTGSTSGIGREFSRELARKGFDIVLVSRSAGRLRNTAVEIEEEFNRKTKIVVADALDRKSIGIITEAVKDLEIGILVNNVGLNTSNGMKDMIEVPEDNILGMINVNAGLLAALSRSVGAMMAVRGKGLIVNIGSTSGYQPLPYQNVYNATKSFSAVLTRCLELELGGVETCYLYPQFVRTNMTSGNQFIHNLPVWTQNPSDYAKNSVSLFGLSKLTSGHWFFEFLPALTELILSDWVLHFAWSVIKIIRRFEPKNKI